MFDRLKYQLFEKRYFASKTAPEFVDPQPDYARRYRIRAMVFAVPAVLLCVGLETYFAPYWKAMSVCEQLPWDRAMLIASILIPLVVPLLELPSALRRFRTAQIPSPGERVARRTRVIRGTSARVSAGIAIAASLACIAIPFWGWYVLKSTPVFMPVVKCGEIPKD
ncbi:MAG: hypothetical protein ABI843_14470 [Dokdonella sp.]